MRQLELGMQMLYSPKWLQKMSVDPSTGKAQKNLSKAKRNLANRGMKHPYNLGAAGVAKQIMAVMTHYVSYTVSREALFFAFVLIHL